VELRGHFGIKDINEMLHTRGLKWFILVERIGDDNWRAAIR